MAEHRAQTYQSLVLRGKLLTAVRWITERETGGVFQPGERCTKMGDQVMEVLRAKQEALTAALEGPPVQHALQLRRVTKTGAYLTVHLPTVNGTELGAQEWHDTLLLQYILDPPDLPTHCDGCQANLLISHVLDCKKGGLVTARQNEIRDWVEDLAGKAFTPSHVRDDPLIYSGCSVKRKKATPDGASGNND